MMSVNSNKRKGRIHSNSNKLGRSKFYSEKNMSCDGIYGNSKLMYAAASLVGCVVQVQVQNGTLFEGVLRTFSHQFDLVLETAHKVNSKCTTLKGISPAVSNLIASYPFEGGIFEKLVFKLSDVILLQACNVDVDFAVKDSFTDTAISKYNGQIKERELEPWEGAGSDSESTPGLVMEDDDGMNGWDANDMFRTNAEKYGVKSSYDNSLQEYTVPLTKKDTEEYKMQEAKALKIAQEIETNSSYQSRIQLENGDEEDRFSAVVRPDDSIPTKYVLPQKRRNIPGLKRQPSSTSSPTHVKPPYTSSNSCIPNPGGSGQLSPPSSLPVNEGQHLPASSPSLVPKCRVADADDTPSAEVPHVCTDPSNVESAPTLSAPSKMQVLCPSQTLPPRIERRRENEKKFSKQKGRTDEIEEFKKFSSNFKLTEEKDVSESEEQTSEAEVLLANKMERTKIDGKDEDKSSVVKYSTLNPNAKEFVLNPNAKSFTPRSMASITSQASVPLQPPPPSNQQQAPPPAMMIPHQPIFTAMAPHQYHVMHQAPHVSMAQLTTSPFATANQTGPRFRKVPITMLHRHELTPHVAAATGQPILAPASMPTVQYASPQGVIHTSVPNQPGYPQMNFIVGPRVVSPQPVGVIPTSHSVSYCDTSHLPTHLIMSAHPGAASHSVATTPHTHLQQQGQPPHSNHHHQPPQSQTPVHPSPSPVHQVPPPQPPTPTTVMYPGSTHPLAHPSQAMNHPMHQHHAGFPAGPQPVVLMQPPQPGSGHHHHHHHGHPQGSVNHHSLHHHHMHSFHHSQNPGSNGGGPHHPMLSQMTIIPTSGALTSAPTPPFVQQHP